MKILSLEFILKYSKKNEQTEKRMNTKLIFRFTVSVTPLALFDIIQLVDSLESAHCEN